MTDECLTDIHPDLHGINIDLKAFSDKFYKKQCGAKLEPVLNSIRKARGLGVWVEVTTLLIPGLNDSDGELKDIAGFLAGVDPGMPWHISRFHPTYRLTDIGPTPAEALHRARDIGYSSGLEICIYRQPPGRRRGKDILPRMREPADRSLRLFNKKICDKRRALFLNVNVENTRGMEG